MNRENNRLKDILTLNELSCYALQAVVVWDDVTDRLEELPETTAVAFERFRRRGGTSYSSLAESAGSGERR